MWFWGRVPQVGGICLTVPMNIFVAGRFKIYYKNLALKNSFTKKDITHLVVR